MIPALAFNEANASITDKFQLFGDQLSTRVPEFHELIQLSNGLEFKAKATSVSVNDLIICSTSHTGIYFERSNATSSVLVIPIEGEVEKECDSFKHKAYGGSSAVFLTGYREKNFSVGSTLSIHLNIDRLANTCEAMLANDTNAASLDSPCTLPTELKGISFSNLFKLLLNQIDIADGNLKLLEKLAFDDRVYRLSAGLIYPHLLLSEEPISGRRPQASSELDMLCEHLSANLKQSISLTQMEQMSGLSARKLQYAFRKKFGIGARGWLRKQRLHAARTALWDTQEPTTVEFVAYDFCFVSPSEFSWHYQQEFGELPEQTFRRGRS